MTTERRIVGEAVLHVDGEGGPVDLPVAIVADLRPDARIEEVRVYYSSWRLTRRHANRLPVLQPDAELPSWTSSATTSARSPPATPMRSSTLFEPDGYAREPAGVRVRPPGCEGLRSFYEWSFSTAAASRSSTAPSPTTGAPAPSIQRRAMGPDRLQPEAGVAVYVRGESGKLAAARSTTTATHRWIPHRRPLWTPRRLASGPALVPAMER